MRKQVTSLVHYLVQPKHLTDARTCSFCFSVFDSPLAGPPRQAGADSIYRVDVTITREVLVNWDLVDRSTRDVPPARMPDLARVLFWYAKEYVQRQIEARALPQQASLEISSKTAGPILPLDIPSIPDPAGFTFDVDLPEQAPE